MSQRNKNSRVNLRQSDHSQVAVREQLAVLRRVSMMAACLVITLCSVVPAQTDEAPAGEADAAEPSRILVLEQGRLADRFGRLEELLLRRAEVMAAEDPELADLLRKAVGESKRQQLTGEFEAIVRLLQEDRANSYQRAVARQQGMGDSLEGLLKLLLSEDRSRRLEDEKARVQEYLKEINRLLRRQQSLEGRTRGQEDPAKLSEAQGRLAEDAGQLSGKMQADRAAQEEAAEGNRGESADPSDPKDGSSEDKPSEDEDPTESDRPSEQEGDPSEKSGEAEEREPSSEGSQSPGESQPNQSQPSDQPSPSEGSPTPGEPPPSDSPPSDQQSGTPGESGSQSQPAESSPEQQAQQQVQQAGQHMQQAREELKKQQKEAAREQQREAIDALEQAAAELEEILRQLREEELARTLARLEARCRRMLEMQTAIYKATRRLGDIPPEHRDQEVTIEANRLADDEQKIVLEADRALTLMREEGSAVAFPVAMEQTRDDMEYVVELLGKTQVGPRTQHVEEDILAALEEMIAAFEQAQRDLEEQQQNPQQQGQPMSPENMPLVDRIAELKVIRSLQLRVNRRTTDYEDARASGEMSEGEFAERIDDLTRRQQRIYQTTRHIVTEKNR